ncbi:MAG: thiopurine S-methyltransferase [Thioalkalispiraceae bacterium]|jgi:thiopurine S-methyltransferase
MEAAYWHNRWENDLVGFHLDDVNPYLQKYWPVLDIQPGQQVLVPLCGKSLDMLWLAGQGYQVMGVEISPVAVERFFDDNGLVPEKSRDGDFEVWQSGDIRIYCGDFFALSSEMVCDIDAVYDRASLVALPRDMRQQYADHIQQLFSKGVPTLLVSLNYDQNCMQGPPFAVSEDEVQDLYRFRFQHRKLCSCDVLANNDRFREKGLRELLESVYLLTPKQG